MGKLQRFYLDKTTRARTSVNICPREVEAEEKNPQNAGLPSITLISFKQCIHMHILDYFAHRLWGSTCLHKGIQQVQTRCLSR